MFYVEQKFDHIQYKLEISAEIKFRRVKSLDGMS